MVSLSLCKKRCTYSKKRENLTQNEIKNIVFLEIQMFDNLSVRACAQIYSKRGLNWNRWFNTSCFELNFLKKYLCARERRCIESADWTETSRSKHRCFEIPISDEISVRAGAQMYSTCGLNRNRWFNTSTFRKTIL